MISYSALLAILLVVIFIADIIYFNKGWLSILAVLLFFPTMVVRCTNDPEYIEKLKAKAEADRLAAIPHVIREADGCKVYSFVAGDREHFYTRCGSTVTTDQSYKVKVPCGKNCTREEVRTETIVTEENK